MYTVELLRGFTEIFVIVICMMMGSLFTLLLQDIIRFRSESRSKNK